MTWAQSLDANYTDGILVLHRGRIVYERYFGALSPERQHIAFSVTKSFVATLAGMLIAEGTLDERATVGRYLPELRAAASATHGPAAPRHDHGPRLLEDYADERRPSGIRRAPSASFRARPAITAPRPFYEFLGAEEVLGPRRTFVYSRQHRRPGRGAPSRLRRSLSELLRERLFAKLGAEQDAYFPVDPTGVEFAGGGLNLTLRDLARFGELMRLDGRWNGQQIVPKAFIDDVRRGGDREKFARAGYKMLPGWSYRSMWWVSHKRTAH